MKRRDLVSLASAAATLVGVGGQFGLWWALIVGGVGVVSLTVLLTLSDLKRPRRRRKPDGA